MWRNHTEKILEYIETEINTQKTKLFFFLNELLTLWFKNFYSKKFTQILLGSAVNNMYIIIISKYQNANKKM